MCAPCAPTEFRNTRSRFATKPDVLHQAALGPADPVGPGVVGFPVILDRKQLRAPRLVVSRTGEVQDTSDERPLRVAVRPDPIAAPVEHDAPTAAVQRDVVRIHRGPVAHDPFVGVRPEFLNQARRDEIRDELRREIAPGAAGKDGRQLERHRQLLLPRGLVGEQLHRRDTTDNRGVHLRRQQIVDHGKRIRIDAQLGPVDCSDNVLGVAGFSQGPGEPIEVRLEQRVARDHRTEFGFSLADTRELTRDRVELFAQLGTLAGEPRDLLGRSRRRLGGDRWKPLNVRLEEGHGRVDYSVTASRRSLRLRGRLSSNWLRPTRPAR